MEIQLIFPTVISYFNLEPALSEKEKEILLSLEEEVNMYNMISKTSNILDHPDLDRLKKFITVSINQYLNEVIDPIEKCELYVTLSWVNYTDPGQSHHLHYHPNSILSGVFYVDVDAERDRIVFSKSERLNISIRSKKHTELNSETWWVPVRNNLLIIFPSHIHHEVPPISQGKKRISLSFNTFFKGTIGQGKTTLQLGDFCGKSI